MTRIELLQGIYMGRDEQDGLRPHVNRVIVYRGVYDSPVNIIFLIPFFITFNEIKIFSSHALIKFCDNNARA